jgi:DNA polymerase-1
MEPATHRDFDVVLIDMGSIFAAAWHSSGDDEVSMARRRSVSRILEMGQGHEHVAVCCDSRKNWRKAIAPSYKAQREQKPEAYFEELRRTREELEKDGLVVWECEGYEADDVIATAAKEAVQSGFRVLVHSADKDMLQLVRDDDGDTLGTVTVCSPRDGRRYKRADVLDKFGVAPEQMRDWLALCGDTSDNIQGCAGVGPGAASKLLKRFGDIPGILAAEDADILALPRIGPSILTSLRAWDPTLAVQLVTLMTDAPVSLEGLWSPF